MSPQDILRNVFGYQYFRGEQEKIIGHILADGDALVLMPTGSGKSLCYQIPALIRAGVAVVISPLIALMQDQVNALQQVGIRAACLNSSLTVEETQLVSKQLQQGELDLLYVAPEKLVTSRFLECLETTQIALFAIDEAHCLSQWGPDFRPEYTKLSILSQYFPTIPRIALTATADVSTRQDIISYLGLEKAQIFITGFDRPNIRYRVVDKKNVRRQLLNFLEQEHHDGAAGIVYCLSRKKVEEIAAWLVKQGWTAVPYHAGLEQKVRKQNHQRFLQEENLIVVATIAFGMGIDKPNVRFVAHLDLPKSLETYYQETGRAGRDGLPANAWMAYGLQDIVTLSKWLEHSKANEQHQQIERQKLEAMLGYCEMTSCRRQTLLAYFGEHLSNPCGNCDTCLEPIATWDGTEVAQKALSCVYRTGQQFGIHYLIDVLLGKSNEYVKQFGHDQVSTFGIGKELSLFQWHSVFRQLIVKKLVTIKEYGGLQLMENARPILRGKQSVYLRKELESQIIPNLNVVPKEISCAKVESQIIPNSNVVPKEISRANVQKRVRDNKSTRSWQQSFQGTEQILWEALRTKRLELALAQNIAPYEIFHDSTLREMIQKRPFKLEELAQMAGVGPRHLERYGNIFLEILHEYALKYDDTSNNSPQ
jgi:ATP-dependent DNA helicase RecQ